MAADYSNSNVNNETVLAFAQQEWERLRKLNSRAVGKAVWLCTWEQLRHAEADLLDQANKQFKAIYSDSFFIIEKEEQIIIAGNGDRAVLFGVYQYAQDVWGLHAVYPLLGDESLNEFSDPKDASTRAYTVNEIHIFSPAMERRGFVFETINDPSYLKAMIHWFGQNKINEMFFTFSLWDQVKEHIAPEIRKRGIQVTLGGHSMKFLQKLNTEEADHPQETANHPYTAKEQFDFENKDWQLPLIHKIIAYCRTVPNLTTISLWPEDIAAKQSSDFVRPYIEFTELLKDELARAGLSLSVEHIAYNAGLAWHMLELSGDNSASIDTLYAYWGRDYRFGYVDSPKVEDKRAEAALKQWAAAVSNKERKLTIFEYYSDHYMLTNLFPNLSRRIIEDVTYYSQYELHGMTNLVVPYRGEDDYSWKRASGLNSYVFAQAFWIRDYEQIMDNYYSYYPKHERASARRLMEAIEEELAAVTSWNVVLFPARATDPLQIRNGKQHKEAVIAMLQQIEEKLEAAVQDSTLVQEHAVARLANYVISYARRIKEQWISL